MSETLVGPFKKLLLGVTFASLIAGGYTAGTAGQAEAGGQARCKGVAATIVGTAGGDDIDGTRGRDVIVGRGGSDDIEGKGGNDLICGGKGGDDIEGDSGNDKIYGGRGNDELEGDRGRDLLHGGPGFDEGDGGPGSDRCPKVEDRESC